MLQGETWVDTGLWGGIVPDNAGDSAVLQGMLDAGAMGFKSFMIESGRGGGPVPEHPSPRPHWSGTMWMSSASQQIPRQIHLFCTVQQAACILLQTSRLVPGY